MVDRYLWDGGGTPDPFVARIERSLAAMRAELSEPATCSVPPRLAPKPAPKLAAAAILIALAAGALVWFGVQYARADEVGQSSPVTLEEDLGGGDAWGTSGESDRGALVEDESDPQPATTR